MSDFSHLLHLSELRSNAGIKFLTPAVYPGNHCPMRFSSEIIENINGLSSLVVGTQECATHSRIFIPESEGENGELHWLYVLDAQEVVFGCRNGLMDALKKMDKAGARAVMIIATCVPDLIGEDIEGIIHEVQPELSAKVSFAMLGQFRNTGHTAGSWKTTEALATLMTSNKSELNRINVLGGVPERRASMPSILTALSGHGLDLRYLGPGADLEDFQTAPNASLNIVASGYSQSLAAKMELKFGIQYIAMHTLYDIEDIDKAYSNLADRFDFSLDNIFKEDREHALALQNKAKEKLNGLKFILANRIDMPLPLAAYLTSLGMEPLVLHLEEYYPNDSVFSRKIIAAGYDPLVCRIMNQEADLPILEKLAPDLCFGQIPRSHSSMKQVKDSFRTDSFPGYTRTINLLERIFGALDGRDTSARGGRGRHRMETAMTGGRVRHGAL